MAELSQEADRLAAAVAELDRTLAHVPDPQMRGHLVKEAVEGRPISESYALVSAILLRPVASDSTFDVLRDALRDLLLDPAGTGRKALDYELRRDLYAEASRAGDEVVMRALRSFAPRTALGTEESTLPRGLADVPLGRRRSLAKGGDARLLEQLARDPDPVVVANLLRNPRLREDDVLRMAALRPVAAAALVEIHRSPRWSVRPRIRLALARNPYCPVDIALKVLGALPGPELREIAADGKLHPEVRRQARLEGSRRRGASLDKSPPGGRSSDRDVAATGSRREDTVAEQKIGVVTHYFGRIGVAAIELTDGALAVGDTIHVKGHTSDFTQTVDSMQVEHDSVESADAGTQVGLKVAEHAREHDEVFKVTPE